MGEREEEVEVLKEKKEKGELEMSEDGSLPSQSLSPLFIVPGYAANCGILTG